MSTSCLLANSKIIVGVSDKPLLVNKTLGELIEPLDVRMRNVEEFIDDIKPGRWGKCSHRGEEKLHTAKNAVHMLQLLSFANCNISVQTRPVATCHLQTCYNLLKQLAANHWITSFDDQFLTSSWTTCSRRVVNKLFNSLDQIMIVNFQS